MTITLPDMSDMTIKGEWQTGMPYLPNLTEIWLSDNPHPNYYLNWYLWCDLDTKATYIMQTGEEDTTGMTMHCGDLQAQISYTDEAAYAMSAYKIAYMWDTTGKGYMLANEYGDYGWWCLDDCLYDMMLCDMADEWHLKKPEEDIREDAIGQLLADEYGLQLEQITDDMRQEWLEKRLMQIGMSRHSAETEHLNNCLQQ